jgi:hypothetical protein
VNALEKSNDDESSSSVRGQKQPSGGTVVSNKLLAETIAPFRGLRLFFYGAFASGILAINGAINFAICHVKYAPLP